MGTNDWVVPIFDRAANEHNIVAVFTRAPKPAGRKMELQKSPVHIWAESRNIPVYTKISDLNHKSEIINHKSIDYIVVASYGVILKDDVLNAAPTINIHPSLLPKYRGPAPMLSAILNGDSDTGVCLMKLTRDVDAGPIYMCRKIKIGENDTIVDLEKNVASVSTEMLSGFLQNPKIYSTIEQIGTPTYTHKFSKEDTIIDWSKSPQQIHNQVRSIGGRTKINGIDVKILETKLSYADKLPPCGGGCPSLEIIRIQPAGKKPMDWKSFVNGLRGTEIKIGE